MSDLFAAVLTAFLLAFILGAKLTFDYLENRIQKKLKTLSDTLSVDFHPIRCKIALKQLITDIIPQSTLTNYYIRFWLI